MELCQSNLSLGLRRPGAIKAMDSTLESLLINVSKSKAVLILTIAMLSQTCVCVIVVINDL